MKAIVVWHYYENGKLVGYSITEFEGNTAQLADCLKNDETREPRNKEKMSDKRVAILHQVIFL